MVAKQKPRETDQAIIMETKEKKQSKNKSCSDEKKHKREKYK